MKGRLAIEFDGLKRYIEVPFRICCDRETAETIRKACAAFLDDKRVTYGWFDVVKTGKKSEPNTQPLQWRESAAGGE